MTDAERIAEIRKEIESWKHGHGCPCFHCCSYRYIGALEYRLALAKEVADFAKAFLRDECSIYDLIAAVDSHEPYGLVSRKAEDAYAAAETNSSERNHE